MQCNVGFLSLYITFLRVNQAIENLFGYSTISSGILWCIRWVLGKIELREVCTGRLKCVLSTP
jgi:hypothetical protein